MRGTTGHLTYNFTYIAQFKLSMSDMLYFY